MYSVIKAVKIFPFCHNNNDDHIYQTMTTT